MLSRSWKGVSTPDDVGAGSRHFWFPDGNKSHSGVHVEKFGHSANQTSPLALPPPRERSRLSMLSETKKHDPMGVDASISATKRTTTLGPDVTGSARISGLNELLDAASHKTGRPMRGSDFGGSGPSGGSIAWQPSFAAIEKAQRASKSRTSSAHGSWGSGARSATPNLHGDHVRQGGGGMGQGRLIESRSSVRSRSSMRSTSSIGSSRAPPSRGKDVKNIVGPQLAHSTGCMPSHSLWVSRALIAVLQRVKSSPTRS